MVNSINHINYTNYNTVAKVKSNSNNTGATVSHPALYASAPTFTASQNVPTIRTSLSGKEEKQKYSEVLKHVEKATKKQIEIK